MWHRLIRAEAICVVCMLVLLLAFGSIRWAKRTSIGGQLLASTMLLALGFAAPIVQPPQQYIEAAQDEKGKKGSESGEPPVD